MEVMGPYMKYEERVVKPPLPGIAQACCPHASSSWAQPGKQRHSLIKRRTKGELSQPTAKPCPCLPTPHQNPGIPWWVPQHIDLQSPLCHIPFIPILPRPQGYTGQNSIGIIETRGHCQLLAAISSCSLCYFTPTSASWCLGSLPAPRIVVFLPCDLLTGMPPAACRGFPITCWHISLEWKEHQHNPAKTVSIAASCTPEISTLSNVWGLPLFISAHDATCLSSEVSFASFWTLLCLASFTQHNSFGIPPSFFVCLQLAPFSGWVIFYCMNILQICYPVSC